MLKRISIILVIALAICNFSYGQVTTSSIAGSVKDSSNTPLTGASITAVHTPSGTVYQTIANKDGLFTLPAMRVGGPYTLTISFAGKRTEVIENITLALGETYNANLLLSDEVQNLGGVTVSGTRRTTTDKTGASTNINSRQIAALPTISRSITDFTRLTPQSNGNNFAGRDARYNNVTVDGANLNNNFGLSSDPLPGGGSNPISLDAFEEITVNIAPYDVRQAAFTGANIVAVTKSGTNTFKGTAYTYYKDQSFNGTHVGRLKLPEAATSKTNIYGGSIGGPIIKNKLFFFVNGEKEIQTLPPGNTYTPKGGSGRGNISNTPIDSLRKFSDYLASKYGYNTGKYDNFDNFSSENYKILARIDWNINTQHRLTAKYSDFKNTNDVLLNSTSVPNGATGGTNTWTSVARNGSNAMSFANSNYAFDNIVRTAALELNSNFKSKFHNQLIATFTKIKTTRTTPSQLFPFIDIIGDNNTAGSSYATGARNNYMSAGYEPYSFNNDVKNDVFNITDNFTYYAGKHTLTAGASYEYQYVGNQFMAASQSYYTYGSLADFMNPAAHPVAFALTFSKVPGNDAPYSAELKVGQLGFYLQDEINVSPKFKLSAGIRFDKPIYLEDPIENPAITALSFPDAEGNPAHYSTGQWPKSIFYVSPRVGFRYDVMGNKSLILRGSTGLYTGRIPFVYLTNMPTNSGMYQFGALANATQLGQITFNPDRTAWQSLFTTPAPTPPTGGFVLIDKNFKFPQVWRTNFGLDKTLGSGWTLSMDMLYTKDVNAVNMRNVNQTTPNATVTLGPGITRPSFANNNTTTRRVYNAYANAILLENNGKGRSFSFTPQISKSFSNGLFGSLAYTYSFSQDVTANPGSTASSTWGNNPTSRTQNDNELSYSQYNVPHRIVATLSYRIEYAKHLASTFSIYYEGASQGNFSYIYGAGGGTAPTGFTNTADVNFDGNSQDLMYIPNNPSEITFTPVTINGVTYSAAQQSDIFFRYIEQDPYLRKHKGQVAERNGAQYPFYHKVDFRFLQDIFTNIGSRRNTLQLSFDCTNFLNLLDRNWGVRDFYTVNNPLRATKNATTGEVRYQLGSYIPGGSTAPQIVDKTFINSYSNSSTWGIQIGVRYIF